METITTSRQSAAGLLPSQPRFADYPLPDFWRRQPRVFRGLVDANDIVDSPQEFFDWARRPAQGRLFMLAEDEMAGGAKSLQLDDPRHLPALFEDAAAKGVEVTGLLNHVELVAPRVAAVRDRLPVTMAWRRDDIVATYSMKGSGIGYHTGNEDGFIIQVAGERRWRLWLPSAAPRSAHLYVLGSIDEDEATPVRDSAGAPFMDITLRPGDAIGLPAIHPQEGMTTQGPSLSLSVAWRGVNIARLLTEGRVSTPRPCPEDAKTVMYGLFPDGPPSFLRSRSEDAIDQLLEILGPAAIDAVAARQAASRYWDAQFGNAS